MRMIFTFHDIQEISYSARRAFVSTFHYKPEESDEESDFDCNADPSDSDLSDYEPDLFGCGDITPAVEEMVENSWEICSPLEEVYGATTSELIKEAVTTATDETQCVVLKFFKAITPGEDRDLIETCTAVCYWCCCETVKRVSPIIAEATTNLMY